MVVIMEDIYDKIVWQDLLKKDNISKTRVQTALKSFADSYLDLDPKNYGLVQRKIKKIQNFKDRCMILKTDKGPVTQPISKNDYYSSLEQLFSD